jgi:hypothetical protein
MPKVNESADLFMYHSHVLSLNIKRLRSFVFLLRLMFCEGNGPSAFSLSLPVDEMRSMLWHLETQCPAICIFKARKVCSTSGTGARLPTSHIPPQFVRFGESWGSDAKLYTSASHRAS